ncbi:MULTISPECIES: hypothetical protein [Bradyrhizobium]|jgi:hypothetical protein|uniref:hypothetical protein n=2 Tax=Nitrobacteraceae TaxID=41294 RepID=UPI00005DCD66|nr:MULTISPECIES: hypothetical protein [Bradyrhizobium]ABQ33026.1 putative exported protein of unknown function [Bradyrhizobium sp. BTAi1]MCL8485387.1 hypothetical protein [Bradyrhizobium denitrificans]MDU0959481.1 hypothetical protein [Bradyrhizobium sp.]MDU1490767.1 hypothetical protein [Bradyrhizobium sp.]MDU1540945.1 hypothetical protein [Bradyrhizobium sp.]
MRILLVVVGLLLSAVAAHAERVIPSGKQLILFNATSVNPDCSALGNVEVRVAQGPEHGKVSIRRTRVFPNYAAVNLRSACNARRVAGVLVTYVSQRGYVGDDLVVIEVFFPNGRAQRTTIAIRVV